MSPPLKMIASGYGLLLCCFTSATAYLTTLSNAVKEYCQEESFSATCLPNQVLVVESAVYGRPKIGRCVKRDLGYLGCNRSAVHVLDFRCGGQTTCDVSVMDPALRELNPCAKDVTWHLFASYRCVNVIVGNSYDCQTRKIAIVPGSSGYLSSSIASRTSIGSASCPWLIQADHGQRVNLTLLNFASTKGAAPPVIGSTGSGQGQGSAATRPKEACFEVAFVRERPVDRAAEAPPPLPVTRRFTACSSEPRLRSLGLYAPAAGNAVEVEFSVRTSASNQRLPAANYAHFLIYYEVLGCATVLPPFGATATRDRDNLVFKCNASGDTWSITCEGNRWVGAMSNCTVPANHVWNGDDFFSQPGFPLGILLVVAVGVALGVFLGGTLLLLASILMRRQRLGQRRHGDGSGLDDLKSPDDLDGGGNHGNADAHHGQKHYIVQDYVSKEFVPAETNDCPAFDTEYNIGAVVTRERERALARMQFHQQQQQQQQQQTNPRILCHVYESPQLT